MTNDDDFAALKELATTPAMTYKDRCLRTQPASADAGQGQSGSRQTYQ
jgi:hypothetical protein